MINKKVVFCSFILSTVALAGFSWFDTKEFFEKQEVLVQYAKSQAAIDLKETGRRDVQNLLVCSEVMKNSEKNKDSSSYEESRSKARSCLIKEISETKTSIGALLSSSLAQAWLVENPDDQLVREAVVKAIKIGRKELEDNSIPMLPKWNSLEKARSESFIMSAIWPEINFSGLTSKVAEKLDLEELRASNPILAAKHDKWHSLHMQ